MRKRYQVFVSATYTDLLEERREVLEALLGLNCFPATMELFRATNEDVSTLVRRMIDESDYFLIILAARYGSRTEQGRGFTELEYEHAVAQRIPVMAFLAAEPTLLPPEKIERDDAGRALLFAFRTKLMDAHHCQLWRTPGELRAMVTESLGRMIQQTPRTGWMRPVHAADSESPSLGSDHPVALLHMIDYPALLTEWNASGAGHVLTYNAEYNTFDGVHAYARTWGKLQEWNNIQTVTLLSPKGKLEHLSWLMGKLRTAKCQMPGVEKFRVCEILADRDSNAYWLSSHVAFAIYRNGPSVEFGVPHARALIFPLTEPFSTIDPEAKRKGLRRWRYESAISIYDAKEMVWRLDRLCTQHLDLKRTVSLLSHLGW